MFLKQYTGMWSAVNLTSVWSINKDNSHAKKMRSWRLYSIVIALKNGPMNLPSGSFPHYTILKRKKFFFFLKATLCIAFTLCFQCSNLVMSNVTRGGSNSSLFDLPKWSLPDVFSINSQNSQSSWELDEDIWRVLDWARQLYDNIIEVISSKLSMWNWVDHGYHLVIRFLKFSK